VSYAVTAGSVDSRTIEDGSIRNKDFKNRTLRGQEAKRDGFGGGAIKESTLGQVPNAISADVATDAKALAGRAADKYTTRWALINEAGQIERQTGGFKLVNCYQDNANCYIDSGEDVTNNGLHAQISVNNTDGSPVFSGETGVAACFAAAVNCSPMGTDSTNGGNNGVSVVTPRASDGGALPNALGDANNGNATAAPAAGDAARFYVYVTGSESQ